MSDRCPTPRKTHHRSRRAAETALLSLWSRTVVDRPATLHTYHCPCGAWHVGHSQRRRAHA